MLSFVAAEDSVSGIAAALAVVGLSALVACWQLTHRGGKPISYPGDPLLPSERLAARGRSPKFSKIGISRKQVTAGWQVGVETQPQGELLPFTVSGQQVWTFTGNGSKKPDPDSEFDPSVNPNSGDKIFRARRIKDWKGLRPDESSQPKSALAAARKGFEFFHMLQCEDGQWAGDYGGPHFLLPGFVIAAYVTGAMESMFPAPHREAMEAYLRNHQQDDGGWGSHLESPSTLFGSVLNYVALRLVGVAADDEACVKGREFLHRHGGALYAPSWAKFWLAVLGVYEWEGIAPVPPEMWLLPSWCPFHPGRMWCHARMVYLPMCYLFARRFSFDATRDPVGSALRWELYPDSVKYNEIRWRDYMQTVADIDNYSPLHWVMRLGQQLLAIYERCGAWPRLRSASLAFVEEYMESEDMETNYLDIGPVSKAFHIVTSWVYAGGETDAEAARNSKPFRAHAARVPAYLWVAEDGMKCQGYNGSMCWDTSFAVQAVVEAGLVEEFKAMSTRCWGFFAREQVRSLPKGDWRHWRQPIRGGWGFSTAEQAWPVSDTTGEAFKALLALRKAGCVDESVPFTEEQYFDSVEFLLSYQNGDGGWATYENNRGYGWYELMNPSEVFGDIMIDYSYVECSASSMGALQAFAEQFPEHRAGEIRAAIRRGAEFIKSIQREDGSWYGCWGNCFTYGCWFGVEGLLIAGEKPTESEPIRKCLKFLLGHQNADGGWGEDFASCFDRAYASSTKLYGCENGSTVVQTAWALLALMAADCDDAEAVQRGITFLMSRQLPNGDWAQENIAGVFNRSIGITYTAFRNVFPLWALGRFAHAFGPSHGLTSLAC